MEKPSMASKQTNTTDTVNTETVKIFRAGRHYNLILDVVYKGKAMTYALDAPNDTVELKTIQNKAKEMLKALKNAQN